MGKARAKMPTSVINGRLSLDLDHIMKFIPEYILGLFRIYNVYSIKHSKTGDLVHDVFFLDTVMTNHISQFHQTWPHCRWRSWPFQTWGAAFRLDIWRTIYKTCDQTSHCWRGNPYAFGDQVNRYNVETTRLAKGKNTGVCFFCHGSDDLTAMIEQRCCQLYKPGNILAIGQLNSAKIIAMDDDGENWADHGAPSGGSSHHIYGNDHAGCNGEEDMQSGETGTGTRNILMDGKGQCRPSEDGVGKGNANKDKKPIWKGNGNGSRKGKNIDEQSPGGERVQRGGMDTESKGTWIQMAKYRGYI